MQKIFLVGLVISIFGILNAAEMSIDISEKIDISSDNIEIKEGKIEFKNNVIFQMPKFRTMKVDAPPDKATHLLETPELHLTSIGKFLRKTSLDELPQILSVIKGEMALVGPRPALYNQDDLISMRTKLGIQSIPPGITGWAQILGRDELPTYEKVKLDEFYLKNRSLFLDMKILILTLGILFKWEQVSH